jgi:hypothetical protein
LVLVLLAAEVVTSATIAAEVAVPVDVLVLLAAEVVTSATIAAEVAVPVDVLVFPFP